jgi:hypothetical protein
MILSLRSNLSTLAGRMALVACLLALLGLVFSMSLLWQYFFASASVIRVSDDWLYVEW